MKNAVKKECLARIEILKEQGLMTDLDVTGLFEKGELCVSEANVVLGYPCGVIMPLSQKKSYGDAIRKNLIPLIHGTPYFAMAQNTSYGIMLSVLCVSNNEDAWETERENLENKEPLAFVYNFDDDFEDVGYIVYEMFNGGPIRTA